MKKFQYGLLAVIGAMAFVACGDDITEVYDENTDFTSVKSVKDEKCTDDLEGKIVYSSENASMYACSDGEWIALAGEESQKISCEAKELKDKSGFSIYCNGDSIGFVKNGKNGLDGEDGADGKDGKNGLNGKNGTDGEDGIDGKNGVDGKNGADGEDGEDGEDGKNGADGKAGKDGKAGAAGTSCAIESATADSVFIACGDEVAAIALPGAGAENYTRPISLTLPFIYESDIGFAPKADVRVMALDDKLNPNGLVFSTEIAGAASKSGNSNQGSNLVDASGSILADMMILFLTGEIKASVKNPYVLVRVDFDVSRYNGDGPGYTYYALADMRDTSALKVSFMSDFKVQRVQKLVADGETIENAMEQADKELCKAFGLDYMGPVEALMDNALDNYDLGWILWTNKMAQEGYSSMGWFRVDIMDLFSKVKSQFALDGNLNTPVAMEKLNSRTNEYEKFDVLLVDLYYEVLEAYGNIESISRMLEEEYGLEPCLNITKDTVAISKARGMLSVDFAFKCGAHDAYWKAFEKEFEYDEIFAMIGECSEKNEWEVNETYFSKRCEKNADGEYAWVYDRDPESVFGFCQPENEDVVKYFGSSSSYYVCQNYQWEELNENQYMGGVICDGKTKKDSVYILGGVPAMCEVSVNGKDSIYAWRLLDETVENVDRLGKQFLGACIEDLYDTVKTVSLGYYDLNLVCDGEKWVLSDIPLGLCDENKVNTLSSKIPTNFNGVVENVEVYKCINNGSQEEPEYRWVSADEIDKNVGFPCTNVKEGFEKDSPIYDFNGESYMCNISTGNWNVLGADRCDQILNPSTGAAYKVGDSFESENDLIYACYEDGYWNAIFAPEEE